MLSPGAEVFRPSDEMMYRLLVNGVTDYAIYMLDPTGAVVNWNVGAERTKGYSEAEIVGRNFSCFYSADEQIADRPAQNLLAAREKGKFEDEGWRFRKDGTRFWANVVIQALKDEQGQLMGYAKITRDRTQQRLAAIELERAKEAAEATARAESEFLANMSHELRTPLTGILGVHDILAADSTLSESQRHLLRLSEQSSRLLLTILNDILDLSKIEAGQMKIESTQFALCDLLARCRQLGLQVLKSDAVRLVLDIAPEVPTHALGDPTRLQQVLFNLVTNAIKFTQAGAVVIAASWHDGRLRIEVRDTGIGIMPEALPRLFERFCQGDNSTARRFGGTGLGLAICKHLVEMMGGTIGVRSIAGTGSTFWFELPLEPIEMTVPSPQRDHPLGKAASRPLRILLAEDNCVNQDIICNVLESHGHRIALASNGNEAVAAFKAEAFDIVLMDVQMPDLNGLAATAQIRAFEIAEGRGRTPILALTADALITNTAKCRSAGMDAYITKPIDWPALCATIETLTAGAPIVAGPDAPAVLDEAILAELARVVGATRVSTYLREFAQTLEDCVASTRKTRSVPEILRKLHSIESCAGQLGFAELRHTVCLLQKSFNGGERDSALLQLSAAANRALQAAAASLFAARLERPPELLAS